MRRLALAAVLVAGLAAGRAGPAAGSWWHSLGVLGLSGAPLEAPGRWIVVVFLGQECPVSNASIPTLNRLAADFGPKGFAFVGAYVDPTADLVSLRAHASQYAVRFDTADDRNQRLALRAGAAYTPQAAVFSADGRLLYLGRIDDRVGADGADRLSAAHEDLRGVLAALAGGAPGPFPGKEGYGCSLPENPRR